MKQSLGHELSYLLILSISSEATIGQSSSETFAKENENHVSLEYVKKLMTDFGFFPDDTHLKILS